MSYNHTSSLNYSSSEDEDDYYARKYGGRCDGFCSPPDTKVAKFQPTSNMHVMQIERFQLFKVQDVEKANFDITFDFAGKKLHAHKFMLTTSEPLMTLISDRWSTAATKDDNAVKIETYSYDNFFEFLCFLYSGSCKLSKDNIVVLTDMSEFFGIRILKGFCDQWLSTNKQNIDEKNIYGFIEMAQRYSLPDFMVCLKRLFNRNLKLLSKNEMFLNVEKEVMEVLSKFKRNDENEEDFFEGAYKWALHRATTGLGAENNANSLQEAIKTELTEIISDIDFSNIGLAFVLSFIIPDKTYLFVPAELYNILLTCTKPYQEEAFFKAVYELAEKEAIKKQQLSNAEVFNLTDSIKTELAEILPLVKFHEMTEKFLAEFVATKGILSRDSALHAHDICVEVKNADKILCGTFKDVIGFFDRVQRNHDIAKIKHKCASIQRFNKFTCIIPSIPSTVSKMKGAEWYLCLERDRVVTLKFHTKISSSDYIITELKPKNNIQFEIDLNSVSYITVARNKMF